MNELLLGLAMTDLAEHPNSSALSIARRIGANSRNVWRVLDAAAYEGKVQRSHPRSTGGPWLWEIAPTLSRVEIAARILEA
jgi:hypothetical protein